MKILAIGNSFSEDAVYYLHQILEAAGIESKVVNLYIPGCPLEKHWNNVETGEKEYQYQLNGERTERMVSIDEMIEEEQWDVIVTQQASYDSGWLDSYEPFLGDLLAHLREKASNAKLFLHETWAYDNDSTHPSFIRYRRSQQEMYERVHNAYEIMAEKYELPLIPSGTLIQKLRGTEYFAEGTRSICRDTFHLDCLYGRYAAACMWAKKICGLSIRNNAYIPETEFVPDVKPEPEILAVIKELVEFF